MHHPNKYLTAEEFLEFESKSATKHEYLNGEVFDMAGGTQAHSLISSNIISILKTNLKGKSCRVHGSELLVRVETTNSFYYPDAMVDCGKYDRNRTFSDSPSLIVEVASRNTAILDRREKLVSYKSIPSLEYYLLVQQTRRHVRIYKRVDDAWIASDVDSPGTIRLSLYPDIEIKFDIEDFYEGTDLNDGLDLEIREEIGIYTW